MKQYIFYIFILLSVSCSSSYQKVLKSDDLDYKMKKALEYYEEEEYFKAIPLFEELIQVRKGTKDVEEIYYKYGDAQYKEGNFIASAYHFKNFARTYPNSDYADDAQYMAAMSLYRLSPHPSLDQTYTKKAIDDFQLFINTYPNNSRVEDANDKIDLLRKKLEEKAFISAKLYYDLGRYKAARTAFKNILEKYPDVKNRELIYFLILKSSYILAEKSIAEKQEERYEDAVKAYHGLIDQFPQSLYLKEAEKLYESTIENLNKIKTDEHLETSS